MTRCYSIRAFDSSVVYTFSPAQERNGVIYSILLCKHVCGLATVIDTEDVRMI